ncbi:hypothetical protein JCM11491_000580 [Sporobolomyces phaffii]
MTSDALDPTLELVPPPTILDTLLVDFLSLVQIAEDERARLDSARLLATGSDRVAVARYVSRQQTGAAQREAQRVEMNNQLQAFWHSLERGRTTTRSSTLWGWTKVYLGVFKLHYLLGGPDSTSDCGTTDSPPSRTARRRHVSSDSATSLARRSIDGWLSLEGADIVLGGRFYSQQWSREQHDRKLTELCLEIRELGELVDAIARVSSLGDWQTRVRGFVQLHSDLLESYRDGSSRTVPRGVVAATIQEESPRSSLTEQVDREVARLERAVAHAEQRRDWAIVDLVYERNCVRRDLEQRRR